jgi:hypothetical protein
MSTCASRKSLPPVRTLAWLGGISFNAHYKKKQDQEVNNHWKGKARRIAGTSNIKRGILAVHNHGQSLPLHKKGVIAVELQKE